jgi:hypothetical protein
MEVYTADTSGNPQAVIDASGRVGIGSSSPLYKLQIEGSSSTVYSGSARNTLLGVYNPDTTSGAYAGIELQVAGAGNASLANISAIDAGSGSTDVAIGVRNSNTFEEKVRIKSSGAVGIGTTGPAKQLHIESTSSDVTLRIGRNGYVQTDLIGSAGAGANDFKITQNGFDRFVIEYGGNSAARIDSSGRLLVGTSSTSADTLFRVQGKQSSSASNGVIQIARGQTNPSSDNGLGWVDFTDAAGSVGASIRAETELNWGASDYPSRLVFSTCPDGSAAPVERLRITNGGASAFYCDSTVDTLYSSSAAAAGTSRYLFIGTHNATGPLTGTNAILIFTNGNVQNTNNSYGAISDIKLKENIVDANSQWGDLKALQVRNYNFKEGQTHTQIGLIAQEVELVSPGLVTESPDRDEDGNDLGTVTKSVNYSVLYMKAVKALQEAMERIEVLEQRLLDAGIA